MKNYYQLLGIPRSADEKTIRRAFRRLARQYHPDVNPSGAARFHEINEAYQVLTDARKRRDYDLTLPRRGQAQSSTATYHTTPSYPHDYRRTAHTTRRVHHTQATSADAFRGLTLIFMVFICAVSSFGIYQVAAVLSGNFQTIQRMPTLTRQQWQTVTVQAQHTATADSIPTTTPAPDLRLATLAPDAALLGPLGTPACIIDLENNRHTCTNQPQIAIIAGPYNQASALTINLDPRHYPARRAVFRVIYGATPPQGITIQIADAQATARRDNDAMLTVDDTILTVLGNQAGDHEALAERAAFVGPGTTLLLEISDQRLRWAGTSGAELLESRFLYALGGQADRFGQNYTIHAGFNRPASPGYTDFGTGVQQVEIWLLP